MKAARGSLKLYTRFIAHSLVSINKRPSSECDTWVRSTTCAKYIYVYNLVDAELDGCIPRYINNLERRLLAVFSAGYTHTAYNSSSSCITACTNATPRSCIIDLLHAY